MDKKQIEDNRKKILERKQLFKRYGYDQDASREYILKKCRPITGTVLEIGTGKGHMTVLLAKNAGRVITVDNSPTEQGFAKMNAAADGILRVIKFVVRDAKHLLFPDGEYGLVVSVNVFHHLKEPFAVLAEMIRVCGGKIVIADFNKKGFEAVRKVNRDEGREHEEIGGDFSNAGQYLKEHGFKVNKYNDCGQIVYVGKKNK